MPGRRCTFHDDGRDGAGAACRARADLRDRRRARDRRRMGVSVRRHSLGGAPVLAGGARLRPSPRCEHRARRRRPCARRTPACGPRPTRHCGLRHFLVRALQHRSERSRAPRRRRDRGDARQHRPHPHRAPRRRDPARGASRACCWPGVPLPSQVPSSSAPRPQGTGSRRAGAPSSALPPHSSMRSASSRRSRCSFASRRS